MRLTEARIRQIILEELQEGPVADAISKSMDDEKKNELPRVEGLITNIIKIVGPAIMKAANNDKTQAEKIKSYVMIALEQWSP